jgi:hypothetical protein
VKPWKGRKIILLIQVQLEVQFLLQWIFLIDFCGFLFFIYF